MCSDRRTPKLNLKPPYDHCRSFGRLYRRMMIVEVDSQEYYRTHMCTREWWRMLGVYRCCRYSGTVFWSVVQKNPRTFGEFHKPISCWWEHLCWYLGGGYWGTCLVWTFLRDGVYASTWTGYHFQLIGTVLHLHKDTPMFSVFTYFHIHIHISHHIHSTLSNSKAIWTSTK